jgi:hypothetical protein
VPHPGHHDKPEDRWSDGGASPGGNVPRIAWLHPRRRAARLAVAIGVVLGVLCIVLGTLALVVELGPRGPGKPPVTARGPVEHSGSGNGQPESFRVRGPGPHDIAWSFNCPRGQTGFKMADSRPATSSKPGVNSRGSQGSGLWIDVRDGGHRVVIITMCRWHASVFGPGSTPEPSRSDQPQRATPAAHRQSKQHGYDKHRHKKKAHHHRQRHSPAPAGGD